MNWQHFLLFELTWIAVHANETLYIYIFLYNLQKNQEGCFIFCTKAGYKFPCSFELFAPPPLPTHPKKLA